MGPEKVFVREEGGRSFHVDGPKTEKESSAIFIFCTVSNFNIMLLVYMYTWGTSVYGLIRRTFVESAQNLTLGKSQGVPAKA